jgi:hypothetical protein
MRRLVLLLLLPVLTAAGLALADARARTPAERLQQFRRELPLMRKLVEGGLLLAKETDPIRRADQCTVLAKDLTQEVQRAVQGRNRARADVLGHCLEKLLVRGVADNLNRLPPNAISLKEVHRLSNEALSVMEPLQQHLDQVPEPVQEQMQNVVESLKRGRASVEEARSRHGKRRSGLKAPPVGKKRERNPR